MESERQTCARETNGLETAQDRSQSPVFTAAEWQLQPQYQATNSPIYRAVWEPAVSDDLFAATGESTEADVQAVMDRAVERVREHRIANTLWGTDGRVQESVLEDLAVIGYWGLPIDRRYGGLGVSFRSFAPFLTRMAAVDPTVAALGSVHGCIGVPRALERFGSESQCQRWLPDLASGRRLSAFALTEPGAGSDLTALQTYAERQGDTLLVYGEKLFVTNLAPGRTLLLICRIDGQPSAVVCELPDQEDATFQLQQYGLHALRRTWNCGVRFHGFRVPAANRLDAGGGGGLTIAYRNLNYARIGLCASAAGTLRRMLADMLPWVRHRRTFGQPIGDRQLVRFRLARLAAMIVACDALVAWTSGLMDQGYRGELEGIVAKVFASDSLRTAAVELAMKTHGGRAFLHGHSWGDRLYDYLAPSIYEGEGELLRLAFFHGLARYDGATTAELPPLIVQETLELPEPLASQAGQAWRELRLAAADTRQLRERFGPSLAEQQVRTAEVADRVLKSVVLLCTCRWAARSDDAILYLAAQVLAQDLSGRRRDDDDYRTLDRLGAAIVEGRFSPLAGIDPAPILLP
jgi:alkylation response protein AidB-like acyl-CoA dehydrogenase